MEQSNQKHHSDLGHVFKNFSKEYEDSLELNEGSETVVGTIIIDVDTSNYSLLQDDGERLVLDWSVNPVDVSSFVGQKVSLVYDYSELYEPLSVDSEQVDSEPVTVSFKMKVVSVTLIDNNLDK